MPLVQMSRECKKRWLRLRESGKRSQYNKVNTALAEAQQTGEIRSLPRTRHGEERMRGIEKFDLGEGYRLVVQVRDSSIGHRVFQFVGTHDETEAWLDSRRGLVPSSPTPEEAGEPTEPGSPTSGSGSRRPVDVTRLERWRALQREIAGCQECYTRWRGEVVRPLSIGEIPDPPDRIDILFIGVAPTAARRPARGTHFYSNARDRLRAGLFRVLAEPPFGVRLAGSGLDEGNRQFHEARCFFVHCAKVRPIEKAAPPVEVLQFCARQHLKKEIPVLGPRAVCFLGMNNARPVAADLFGQPLGERPLQIQPEWWRPGGLVVVAHQPRRGWEPLTKTVIETLWRGRPEV